MISSNAERIPDRQPPVEEYVSIEELARRQGVKPLRSADDLARPGLFESDDELAAFLDDLYTSRRAGMS